MASRGDAKWTALPALQSIWPRWNPACIGHSLWVSTNYDDGERGMAEFRCTSNTMKRPNPYPNSSNNSKQTFQPRYHSICGSHQNGIVLVDGDEGKVIWFDPKTKKYGVPVSIPKLGAYASSLMIQGNVHIFHGHSNDQNQYLVHSLKSGRVSKFECNLTSPPMAYVSITKRSDDLEFYKFGGVNWNTKQYFDSFYVGSLPDGDPKKPIVWKEAVQFRLRQPLGGCGVIQRGPFIVTFGGQTTGYKWLDDIYILDVRSNEGWVQSPIKCPMKSKYIAVLDHQQNVHIFTKGKQDKQHYSIPLRDIIPVLVMPPLAPIRSSKRGKRDQRGKDGDKKGRDGKRAKRDDAKLKEINATLRAMVESLQDELERVKRDNGMYQQVRRALERTNLEMRSLNSSLNAENERLMEQLVIYQDEQKEAQMRIAELEGKVKDLELRSLDVSSFLIWDWKQIHFWIMAVEKGRFQKYEAVLREALEQTDMVGEDLLSVNPLVIKMWGITDRKDRERMNGHIQDLLQQQRVHGGTPSARTPSARSPFARSPLSEGDPTTFV